MSDTPRIDAKQLIWFLKITRAENSGKYVSGQDIANRFKIYGTNATRRVREQIHEMRRQGIPICSTSDGYYYPESREDALPAMRHLTSLFQPLRESYTGFMNGLDEMFEPNLFDQEAV